MRYCYALELPVNAKGFKMIAIADLIKHPGGLLLSRINVPTAFRKRGYGNKLLQKVLIAADKDGTTLFLHVSSAGAMSDKQLASWYMRNGFKWRNALMMERAPRGKQADELACPHCIDGRDHEHTLEHEGKP